MTIFGGNDGIRDTWSPYGEPDMLARAMLIGMRNDLRRDEEIGWALECVTTSAARACGFADYGLTPGARADWRWWTRAARPRPWRSARRAGWC